MLYPQEKASYPTFVSDIETRMAGLEQRIEALKEKLAVEQAVIDAIPAERMEMTPAEIAAEQRGDLLIVEIYELEQELARIEGMTHDEWESEILDRRIDEMIDRARDGE